MIIDFHTHAFADPIAPKAMASLCTASHGLYTPCTDGTVKGLLNNMAQWGIDHSVIQPVATKPSQIFTINQWAKGLCGERLTSFGAFHPHTDDYKRDIDLVVSLGLKGIKLHPEYQQFQVDDPAMLKMYDYALSKGLILLFHAGNDPAFQPPMHSNPRRFADVAREMRGGVIVAAHLGGNGQWDEVERELAGTDVYMDTSMGFFEYGAEQFLRIVKKHGVDKILFGSDAPWSRAKEEIEAVRKLPLTDAEKDAILGGNAMRLLGMK
ncbi:MAG: amidohydrolase family protein [Clostridia bacterium]|nr:amidohydrolase family protein [Clostridia bacterium]